MIRALAVAGLLALAACSGAASPPELPPTPTGARPLQGNGAWETPYDLAVSRLHDQLEPRMGRVAVTDYLMPADATWPSVAAHYDRALTGWTPDERVSGPQRGYELRVWRRSPGQVIAVAWFDRRPTDEDPQILAVVVPRR